MRGYEWVPNDWIKEIIRMWKIRKQLILEMKAATNLLKVVMMVVMAVVVLGYVGRGGGDWLW